MRVQQNFSQGSWAEFRWRHDSLSHHFRFKSSSNHNILTDILWFHVLPYNHIRRACAWGHGRQQSCSFIQSERTAWTEWFQNQKVKMKLLNRCKHKHLCRGPFRFYWCPAQVLDRSKIAQKWSFFPGSLSGGLFFQFHESWQTWYYLGWLRKSLLSAGLVERFRSHVNQGTKNCSEGHILWFLPVVFWGRKVVYLLKVYYTCLALQFFSGGKQRSVWKSVVQSGLKDICRGVTQTTEDRCTTETESWPSLDL